MRFENPWLLLTHEWYENKESRRFVISKVLKIFCSLFSFAALFNRMKTAMTNAQWSDFIIKIVKTHKFLIILQWKNIYASRHYCHENHLQIHFLRVALSCSECTLLFQMRHFRILLVCLSFVSTDLLLSISRLFRTYMDFLLKVFINKHQSLSKAKFQIYLLLRQRPWVMTSFNCRLSLATCLKNLYKVQ